MGIPRPAVLLLGTIGLAAAAACSSTTGVSVFGSGVQSSTDGDGGALRSDGGQVLVIDQDATIADGGSGSDVNAPLAISPAQQTIDVVYGGQTPTVTFTATANGSPVAASFAIDRGEIGTIGTSTGILVPSGTVGGTATVTATYGASHVTAQVTVRVHAMDDGAPATDAGAGDSGDAGGSGGNGGVGGEGLGGPVDAPTQATLLGTPAADTGLSWSYPYDQTLWPRGMRAPLLQWASATRNYDAVYIHLQEAAFEYQGFFAETATPFVHHPVPQAAWDALAYSNQGEDVTVTLVFASGGQAYGPITETWKIAGGSLNGTVYYNSYGTNLAHNYCCTIGGAPFGGATLAIRHGATDPVLVAGNDHDCRVCHTVSADGSRLVTNRDTGGFPYDYTSVYDLKNGYAETTMSPGDGRFGWSAVYPDGRFVLSDGAPLEGAGWNGDAQLFALPDGGSVPSTGIPAGLRAGSPVFSPDGKHVAFNFYAGQVADAGADGGGAAADGKSLAMMDYDVTISTFSNFQVLFTPPSGTSVWPSYLPTSNAVVFELETLSNGRDFGGTRAGCDSTGSCSNSGTQAELWWVDVATKTAARMDRLNGLGVLPTGPDHANDAVLNYEPTVSPVPSGGYAWVVLTSRRLYGNIATINPYWSDPRYHDISETPTTKKLWVAAIDLNAAPGTDPSHPAFYLPGQELLAGNSRGYWVLDPCQANGASCQTGDQCCGGYCSSVGGALACSDQPPACSTEYDKCTQTSDCCGAAQGMQCLNGRCATTVPPIVPK
jgi:hypothetical protein